MNKFYFLSAIIFLSLAVAIIMMYVINSQVCNQNMHNQTFPDFATTMLNYQSFVYVDKNCRIGAIALATSRINEAKNILRGKNPSGYKIVANLNAEEQSDAALNEIITTDVLTKQPQFLRILNDSNYASVVQGYDVVKKTFLPLELKTKAVNVISEYEESKDAKQAIKDKYKKAADADVYKILRFGFT